MHNVILVKGPQGMNHLVRNLQAVISSELGPVVLVLEELGQCSLHNQCAGTREIRYRFFNGLEAKQKHDRTYLGPFGDEGNAAEAAHSRNSQ